MNIAVLPSARALAGATNCANFIAQAKALSAFGRVSWDEPVWENVVLSKSLRETSGKTGAKALHFLAGKGGAAGCVAERQPLKAPFADFLKAAVRSREAIRPQHVENHRVMIRAGRYLHDALAQDAYDPCLLLPRHFDEAAKLARDAETHGSAYATGKLLAELCRVVDGQNIARVRIGWKNTTPRPSSDDRITSEAETRREERLPTLAALDALPQMSALVTEDMDVLRMRVVELLVCGGWRINELLSIPADCEVEETSYENGQPVLDWDGDPVVRYGIRYFAEKGFGPTIKWIPTAMVDVARRAVSDCRRLTQAVRDDAVWMESNPGCVPLLRLSEGAKDTLTMVELEEALGLGRGSGLTWCMSRKLARSAEGRKSVVLRKDVVAALLRYLPVIRPAYPVRLSGHMFLVRENSFHRTRAMISGTVRLLLSDAISNFITGGAGVTSAFAKFGFSEPDGSPIRMNTHQFRHWLNTMAQDGGLSQELVARWSGRKDLSQNAAYDHVSGRKLAEHVRVLAEKGEMRGSIAKIRDRLPPADRKAFLETQIATAHVTEIGLCIHDWSLAPCPVHGDCSSCDEHVVDKGNADHRAEADRQLNEVGLALQIAAVEADDETYGASRWEEAHRRKRDGLKAVLAIHSDVSIPDGTLVHLGAGGRSGR